MADHQGPVAVGEDLAQRADLTDRLEVAGLDHGERFVQPDRLALLERRGLDVRGAGEAHLATRGEHVDGVVLVGTQQHAVAARWLSQPVNLLAQREELLTGFFEGVHELGVARRERVDPRLKLVNVAGTAQSALGPYRILQLLTQNRGLTAQRFQLGGLIAGHGLRVARRETLGVAAPNALTHSYCAPSRTASWCSNNFNATGDSAIVCALGTRHTSTTVSL